MKGVIRAVIDTNIFISALLKSKNCVAVLEALKEDKFELLTTRDLKDEFIIVVEKPKFEFTEFDKNEAKELLNEKGKQVIPVLEKISVCRDPKDNMVLECALAGRADVIVTGDKDLLSLKKFKRIPILTPQQFIKRLKD